MTASSSGPALIDHSEPPLSAPLTLSFDYTRSVGPTLSRFFTALRARRIVGVRGSDGRVHVPPVEYDPVTYEPLSEMVPVSSVGTVASWTWQPEPLAGQPLDRPFAWALIKLDGADTLLMHAVDVGTAGPSAIHTGARVHAHWADQPVGAITDIACFALGETAEPVAAHKTEDARDPVTMIVTPIQLEIQHTASHEESAYLRAIAQGKLVGARTGKTGKVYFPPHGADPATGKPTSEFVELPDKGTVTTFAIVNIRSWASESSRPMWRPTCCSTAPTSRFCIWFPTSTRTRCGWACASRRCGSRGSGGDWASTTSSTSAPPANRMPTTTPTSTTCKGPTNQ